MVVVLVLVVAGCSAKPVGGNTGETSVFEETVANKTKEADLKEVSKIVSFEAVEGMAYVVVEGEDGTLYYKTPLSSDVIMLEKQYLVEPFPVVEKDGDGIDNTSDIKSIDGYMTGRYYAKHLSDTRSTILFVDGATEAHIDLLEVDHGVDESISDVLIDKNFREIYYEVSDSEGHIVRSYLHQLDTALRTQVGDDDQLTYVSDGLVHILSRQLVGGALKEIEAYPFALEKVTEDSTNYEKVLANGIVMDPDTNTMKFGYDIGIIGNEIVAISDATLQGDEVIDVTGSIVAPGFIDMLGFNLTTTVSKYKITDGVTTNLSLHGCTEDFDAFFSRYENRAPQFVNFGGAVFMIRLRGEVGLGYHNAPTQAQIDQMAQRTREEIESGAVAVAFSPEYYPGTSPEEIKAVMAVAAEYDIPTHFHLRYSSITGDDLGIYGVQEVIEYARELDARVQIMHLHSTGGTAMMDEALKLINDARAEGVKITYDIYPYDSWASRMSMQRFRPGWQERYGIDYEDLVIAGTGAQVTEGNFAAYKAQGALAIAYAMDVDEMLAALSEDYAQVGSDGNIESESEANNHFRGAGTFSRILGKYCRDEDVFSLMEGLSKMTINGARHLESVSQDMAHRGRLQEGMIADITVFDYKTVLDQSTPEKPATASIGIEYVLVNGEVGLRDGVLDTRVKAGVGIKSDFVND